ncbi:MAG: ribosome-binding factor A [Patescibacteria group bacterium]
MPHTKRLEEGGGMQRFRDALALVISERVEFPMGALVTLVDAVITRDTRHAKGTISVLPVTMEGACLAALEEYRPEINEGLAKHLRLRRIPKLHWETDHTEEHAAQIDAEIQRLKNEGQL